MLEFYAIESPLAQPRNAVLGQLISSIVGVSICKLFLLSDNFEDLRWLSGSLSCAAATSIMALTKTVHPPAGATALLAITNPNIVSLGWLLIPMVLLGCALMLAVALLVNNIGRRFPLYWWTPEDLRREKNDMFERRESMSKSSHQLHGEQSEEKDVEAEAGADTEGSADDGETQATAWPENQVIIRPGQVSVPEHMYLTQEEQLFLETLSRRL